MTTHRLAISWDLHNVPTLGVALEKARMCRKALRYEAAKHGVFGRVRVASRRCPKGHPVIAFVIGDA